MITVLSEERSRVTAASLTCSLAVAPDGGTERYGDDSSFGGNNLERVHGLIVFWARVDPFEIDILRRRLILQRKLGKKFLNARRGRASGEIDLQSFADRRCLTALHLDLRLGKQKGEPRIIIRSAAVNVEADRDYSALRH